MNKLARNTFVWLVEPALAYWGTVGIMAGVLRRSYHERVVLLDKDLEQNKDRLANDTTWVASIVAQRNQLKQEIRDEGNLLLKRQAEIRNQHKYGNPIGPDYASLYHKQELEHSDWSPAQIREEIVKGATRSNEGVNAAAQMVEIGGYIVVVLLLVRFVMTIYKTPKGDRALHGLHIFGCWLLAIIGGAFGLTYAVFHSPDHSVLLAGIGGAAAGGTTLVFIWDMIFGYFMRRLNRSLAGIQEIRNTKSNTYLHTDQEEQA